MVQLIKVAGWSGKPRAHIVFVHGFGGHAYDTWRYQADEKAFWPLWLARDLKGATIWTLDYAAAPTNWFGNALPLQDNAVSVLEMHLVEPELKDAPLVFVCHSLGGLLVKQMLREANSQRESRPEAGAFFDRVEAVVFIATPHTGAAHANLLDWLRLVVWPSAAAHDLMKNDANLRNLNQWYRDRNWQTKHKVLYETKGTKGALIVGPGAADAGLPGAKPIAVPPEDHFSICKPKSRGALVYKITRDFLESCAFAPRRRQEGRLQLVKQDLLQIESKPINWLPGAIRLAFIALLGFIMVEGTLVLGSRFFPSGDTEIAATKTPKQLAEIASDVSKVASLAKEMGIATAAVQRFFSDIKQKAVPIERWPTELATVAKRYVKLEQKIVQLEGRDPAIDRLTAMATKALESGEFEKAEPLLDRAASRANELAHEIRATAEKWEFASAQLLADKAEAAALSFGYKRAAESYMQAFERAPTRFAKDRWRYINLAGENYYHDGDFIKAASIQEKAVTLAETAYGPGSEQIAESLNNFSVYLNKIGKSEDALENQEKAINIIKNKFGEKDYRYGIALDNLAGTYMNIGRCGEAEEKNLEAINIFKMDPKHKIHELISLSNIGRLYLIQRRYNESEIYINQVLKNEEILEEKDPSFLAYILETKGLIYQLTGDFSEVSNLYNRSKDLLRRIFPINHVKIKDISNRIEKFRNDPGSPIFPNKQVKCK